MSEYDDLLAQVRGTSLASGGNVGGGEADEAANLLAQVRRAPVNQLHSALFDAAFVNPDDYAKRKKLAGEMGYGEALLPPLPDAEALAWLKKNPAESMLKEAPALASWLAEEDHAKLAKDDIPVLSEVGRVISNFGRSLAAGAPGAAAGLWGGLQAVGESLRSAEEAITGPAPRLGGMPLDLGAFLAEASGIRRASTLAMEKAVEGPQAGAGFAEKAVYSGAKSLGQNLLLLPVTIASGSAAPMLAGMGTITGGGAYGQAREQGVSIPQALAFGGSQAAIEVATEAIPALKMLDDLGLNRSFGRLLVNQLAREIPGEQVATALQDLNEWAVLHPERPFADYVAERPAAALQTLIATAVAVGGQTAGAKAMDRALNGAERARNATFFEAMADAGQNSKLLARLPEKYRALVEHYTADGPLQHVFVEAQAFQTYFQEMGQDAQAIAAELGATDYTEALARGGDVAIPLGAFAEKIAPSEHLQGLAPDLKLQPWELTPREAEFAQANRDENERRLGEELAAATEAAKSDTVLSEQIRKITDEVTGQLLTRYDQPTAEALSTVLRGVAVLGQREAQARANAEGRDATPEEIAGFIEGQWAKYGLTIRANPDLPAVLTQRLGFEANLDPLLDMLRRGERPADADIFGESLTEFVRRMGGLQDLGGELSSRDADAGRRPFQKALIQPEGKTFDAMREILAEAGFQVGESEAEFLDALDAELRGSPVYAGGRENAEAMQRRGDLDALAEALQALGIDINAADNAAIKAALFPAASYDQVATTLDDVRQQWEVSGVTGDLSEKNGLITLSRIVVPEGDRSAGKGTAAMQVLVDYADATGQRIALSPSADFGGNKKRLMAFYKRFGFVENKGKGRDLAVSETMLREPQERLYQAASTSTGKAPRGQITIGANRQMRIDLLKDANLSTLLHEVGHFYLELLGDLAESEGASAQAQADYAALLKWFGIDNRGQITTEHHEMFARANEAYLMEGKAPSVELRSTFARFKAWLSLIYRELRRLNVSLSDEVREVFDRIYATDAEIREAQAQNAFVELFTTAESMGVTQAEFELYKAKAAGEIERGDDQLRAKVMRVQRLKREAWWREALAEERKTVEGELDAMKEYQAHAALTAKDAELKLDRADLVRRYGAGILKRLPRGYGEGRGAIYTAEGMAGSSVDVAAELLGFASGDELVESLANLRPKAKVIAAEASRRLEDRHGDLLNSVALADEAQAALHNGERGAKLAMELKALRRLQRIAEPIARARERDQAQTERIGREVANDVPPLEVFREAARRTIAGKKVRDLRPNDYLLAERKANRKAFEALGKKDYAAAQAAKQQELLNFALFREATKAKEEVEKLRAYAKTFEKPAKQQKLGKAGAHYLEAAQALLEDVDLANLSGKAIDRQKLMRWLQEAEQTDLYVTEDMVAGTYAPNWREMTVEQLRAFGDALKNLEHVATRQKQIMDGQRVVDLEAAVEEAVAIAEAGNKLQAKDFNQRGQSYTDAFAEWMGDLLNVRTLAGWLDGDRVDGPWHRLLINRASEAQVTNYDLTAQITAPVNALVEAYLDGAGKHLDDEFASRFGKITRYKIISLAFNLGNASNTDKLLRGGFPRWIAGEGTATPWSEADLRALTAHLDAADWRFVQAVWDLLDQQMYPAINALEQRVNGVPLKKVEAIPFTVQTRDGQELHLRGGYYPMSYDPRFSAAGQKQDTGPLAGLVEGGFQYVSTPKGQTKARTEFAAPANLDFEAVLGRHLQQSILDLSHREFFLDAQRLLRQPKIRQVLQERLGEQYEKEFNNWLKRIANAGSNSPTATLTRSARFWEQARTNTTVLFLGFKVTTVLAQFAGLGNAVEKVGAGWMWKGLQEAAHLPTALRTVMAKSGRMRQRWDTLDQSIHEAMGRLSRTKLERARERITRAAFSGIALADRLVSTPTWLGAYRKALAAGVSEENAIHAADEAVIASQGDGASMELSKLQGERGFTRLFTVFYTPFAAQFNRLYTAGRKVSQGGTRYAPEFVLRALLITAIPAIIADLLTGRGPKSCEVGDAECFAKWAAVKSLSSMMATVPFIREGGQMLEAKFEGTHKPDLKYSPVFSAIERAGGAVSKTIDALAEDDFTDEIFWRDVESSGLVLGLPTAQLAITGEYLADLLTGEADGNTWYRDLFFRRQQQ